MAHPQEEPENNQDDISVAQEDYEQTSDIFSDFPAEAEAEAAEETEIQNLNTDNEDEEFDNDGLVPNQSENIDTKNDEEQTNNSTHKKVKGFYNRAIIFVMSGIHKGAGCSIDKETTIGSDYDNDLILTDNFISSEHLILRPIEKGLDYAIEVICKGESAIINGESVIETEQSVIMQNTFIVTIGTISINVTLHKAAKSKIAYKKYMAPRLRTLEHFKDTTKELLSPQIILSDVRNILLFLIAIVVIMGSILFYVTRPVEKQELHKTHKSFKNIKELTLKNRDINKKLHVQATKDLKYVLKKYDLLPRLDVSYKGNIIFVKGRLNNYEMKSWRKALNWFDTTYSMKINLVELIEINNGLRRTISFKAVVVDGKMPYVVSWTGDRFRPGATLPGGWIILKISDEGVTVKDGVDNRIFLVEHIRSHHGKKLPRF